MREVAETVKLHVQRYNKKKLACASLNYFQ